MDPRDRQILKLKASLNAYQTFVESRPDPGDLPEGTKIETIPELGGFVISIPPTGKSVLERFGFVVGTPKVPVQKIPEDDAWMDEPSVKSKSRGKHSPAGVVGDSRQKAKRK